jgi:hypothetical protein
MRFQLVAAWVLVVGLAACASPSAHPSHKAVAAAQFAVLKTLAGTWTTVQEEGTQPAGQKVRYEVTANGSTLVEVLFAGTTNEMLSVYSLDGDELVLAHYCALGNQPRMRAQPSNANGTLIFDYVGGANLDPGVDTHMHRIEFQFVDNTHMRVALTIYERGQPASVVRLALVRSWH